MTMNKRRLRTKKGGKNNKKKTMHQEKQIFGDIDINQEFDKLLSEINQDGHKFLKGYFKQLTSSELTEQDELKIIEIAIETIKADDKVEYSEIKFFKVIRSNLKIGNESILVAHPDFENYLEHDIISQSYLAKLQNDFFDNYSIPNLKASGIDDAILNTIEKK